MKPPLQIAIDGPVAAGKGDIAMRLAKKLNLLYLYTGAMYRALALACLREGIDLKDAQKVVSLLDQIKIELLPARESEARPYKVLLNSEEVTEKIFAPDVAMGSSDVSTIPEVRELMVKKQQEIVNSKSVVMEGRDIGLRVLPNAKLKIYLTASLEERARRRYLQQKQLGLVRPLEQVLKDTRIRDDQDTKRKVDPLQKLPDAWELDTTNLNQEQVVDRIIAELKRRNLI